MSQFETQRSVKLADGTIIPAIGQGTWFMGENPSKEMDEISALQLGVELGMTLIDTAEMYANGGAELIVGKAIKHIRNKVFLVSKVYPHNAGKIVRLKPAKIPLKDCKLII